MLLAALVVAAPQSADAAACCVSATSFGVGRLLIWEDFALGIQLGHARLLGEWSSAGRLEWNPSGYSEGVTHAQLWLIARLHRRLELQGWLPYLLNDRWSEDAHQVAGGTGDVGAAARFQVLAIGEIYRLPSLAFTAAGFAPTGRRIEQTSPPLFAGATGRGAWGGSLAGESEYAPAPWFVRVEAGVTFFLPFDRADNGKREQYGRLVRVCLSSGRELSPGKLVAAIAAIAEWQSRLDIDAEEIADSAVHLYSLAVSIAWRFDPHWTTVAAVSNSVWPSRTRLGANQDARVDVSMGIRYGHF